MRLVDTSALIEWLVDSPTKDDLVDDMPKQQDWLVPTIVQLELVKWLTREAGEEKADQVLAFTTLCHVVPLDTTIAVSAAELCSRHKLPTADAIVYATALSHDADLLTCDAHFKGLPRVIYVPKKS
jgi:uncharacterized protein